MIVYLSFFALSLEYLLAISFYLHISFGLPKLGLLEMEIDLKIWSHFTILAG